MFEYLQILGAVVLTAASAVTFYLASPHQDLLPKALPPALGNITSLGLALLAMMMFWFWANSAAAIFVVVAAWMFVASLIQPVFTYLALIKSDGHHE